MSVEFWLTICATFIGIALSLLTNITKTQETGAKMGATISFIIAIISLIIGIKNNNKYKENIQKDIKDNNIINQNNSVNKTTEYNNEKHKKMFRNYFERHETETNQVYFSLKKMESIRR